MTKDKEEIAIKVSGVSKSFKLPHEKNTSVKSFIVNPFKKRTFEKQNALEGVSFDIRKGEFFGIVGKNGGGKSTLLKLLAGIYSPSAGYVVINGKLTPFIELGVGFNPELTGRENVYLSGALLGFSRKEMSVMYKEIVDFAELKKFMDQKLKNYSSGMQVRLAFSIAIRAKSDILLLDEVLAVGDASFQQKCYTYFEELKENKKTVVFVSHDMAAVKRFCTRAIYIKEGKLIHEGDPSSIANIYAEENIAPEPTINEQTTDSTSRLLQQGHKISATVMVEDEQSVILTVNYTTKLKDPVFIGISVIKDGISVAEITTEKEISLLSNGVVSYRLKTMNFNGGSYSFSGGLFKSKNRELLAILKQTKSFIIKTNDPSRGGAMKLADGWEKIK